ncbi:hypothetical protein DUI87_18000 [Hirundo rustica rustica]|uniref:Uncharacterized protein n=1 Tax=Hirundo rustica rustica TaxID=333673 RepID=A0A3M0KCE5_HIRRU|nr:hypothetical protein DUI87_18000 [Hirundo rustica rustica]
MAEFTHQELSLTLRMGYSMPFSFGTSSTWHHKVSTITPTKYDLAKAQKEPLRRSLPAGLASLQRPRADEDRSDGFVEQLPAQGEDVTLGATAQEWTHPYLNIYFKGKVMPNYTSQSQVCFSETKYALISKIPPLTHHHFLSEILTPFK